MDAFGPLRLRIGAGQDEDLFQALDRAAPEMLATGRPDLLLADCIDEIESALPDGHPWSALVIANAIHDLRSRRDPACDVLIDRAEQAFRVANDSDGIGATSFVRGLHSMGRGDLVAAARHWSAARDVLGERGAIRHQTLASLALDAYQRGELERATVAAEEAIALARVGGDVRGEAVALTYLGFVCINTGDLRRAESVINAAVSRYLAIPDVEGRVELPIVYGERGIVACLRGQHLLAVESFDRALEVAEEVSVPWFAAICKSARAEFATTLPLDERDADARWAHGVFTELSDEWFDTWSIRASAAIARERGDLSASESMLRNVLPKAVGPCETGLILLRLGETLRDARKRDEAVAALDEAIELFDSCGGRYWLSWAHVIRDDVESVDRGQAVSRFRRLCDDDEVRHMILRRKRGLCVRVLGTPSISVDGRNVAFRTERSELLVYALVLSPRGLHPDQLFEYLWPDAEADRLASRLRTTLWEARTALGEEGWRLVRKSGVVTLDLEGVDVDLIEAQRDCLTILNRAPDGAAVHDLACRTAETLSDHVLTRWSYEEWVHAADERRADLFDRLSAWIGQTA